VTGTAPCLPDGFSKSVRPSNMSRVLIIDPS
jgi:hypothetical protein